MRLDTIELYQHHRPDPKVPYEISIGALKELQAEGKIRHIGVSNVSLDQLETAREIVEVVSVQNRFSLIDRSSQDVLDRCEELGIAFFPWAPIESGHLAQPGGPVDRIASRHDATPAQVALAWLLAHSPVILPIPGTSSVEHLEQNLGAASLPSPRTSSRSSSRLQAEEMKRPGLGTRLLALYRGSCNALRPIPLRTAWATFPSNGSVPGTRSTPANPGALACM